jgi:hypothetical protein
MRLDILDHFLTSQSHVKCTETPCNTLCHCSARSPRSGLTIATSVSVHHNARGHIQENLKSLLYGRKIKRQEY